MITIREAGEQDISKIAELTTELSALTIAPDCTPEGATMLLSSMGEEATRLRFAGRFRHHVACDDAGIVGVVASRDDSHLFHLFVAVSHQRRGIAKRLWGVAKEACLAAGNPGRFTVNSSRRSIVVYRAFGFVEEPEVCANGVPFIPMTLNMLVPDGDAK
jgi:GNAT superfamily N-acetyltransferase